ncbi:hypothetical protein [Chryseobacterium sp. GP-SGM7]
MSSDKDSTIVTGDTISMKDSTPMQNPDTMKMPVDTANVPVK